MVTPRPNLELVIQLYESFLPDCDYLLRKFESHKRWIRFSPRLHELTTQLGCQNYPELYQDETRIQTALFRAFFDTDEQIRQFITDLDSKSPEELNPIFNNFLFEAMEVSEWIDEQCSHIDDLDWSPTAQAKARIEWETLTHEEQQKNIKISQSLLAFGLSSFFNFMALMVHGRKLTQLVNEAMSGIDASFYLAIHIDKNILHHVPYFKARYQRAIQECDDDFLQSVSYRIQSPQLNGRIRHRLLYMLFALLEGTQWLDHLKHREILDICDQLNLDRYENRIETEKAVGDRLRDYHKFQRMNQMSTL